MQLKKGTGMSKADPDKTAFLAMVRSERELPHAQLLIITLHSFGGASPLLAFHNGKL
jgi:hypothetical protein